MRIIGLFVIGGLNFAVHADVYLENAYGATIAYMTSRSTAEGNIGNGNRSASLGNINSLSGLWIRTTGTGSGFGLSPYSDLSYILAQIKKDQKNHTNENAIISITPSRLTWSITVYWEKKNGTEDILNALSVSSYVSEVNFFNMTSAEQRLDALKKGALGAEYAAKAAAICSADYTKAKSKGKINLCDELTRSLVAPPYTKLQTISGPQPDLKPVVDEIKSTIDMLSRSLARYRALGDAS